MLPRYKVKSQWGGHVRLPVRPSVRICDVTICSTELTE